MSLNVRTTQWSKRQRERNRENNNNNQMNCLRYKWQFSLLLFHFMQRFYYRMTCLLLFMYFLFFYFVIVTRNTYFFYVYMCECFVFDHLIAIVLLLTASSKFWTQLTEIQFYFSKIKLILTRTQFIALRDCFHWKGFYIIWNKYDKTTRCLLQYKIHYSITM